MRAPERPNPSPLSSATVAIGAARFLLRRYRVGPVLVILAAAILVIGAMRHAETATANALSRWQAMVEVWTTTEPVDAGETIESGAVRSILVPADLVPVGAVATDPRSLRTRIELGTGEIVVERWLTDTGSTRAARTPEG
jgi:Flp pilus assembly protein CpaB